jgi:hypothetical protein
LKGVNSMHQVKIFYNFDEWNINKWLEENAAFIEVEDVKTEKNMFIILYKKH